MYDLDTTLGDNGFPILPKIELETNPLGAQHWLDDLLELTAEQLTKGMTDMSTPDEPYDPFNLDDLVLPFADLPSPEANTMQSRIYEEYDWNSISRYFREGLPNLADVNWVMYLGLETLLSEMDEIYDPGFIPGHVKMTMETNHWRAFDHMLEDAPLSFVKPIITWEATN